MLTKKDLREIKRKINLNIVRVMTMTAVEVVAELEAKAPNMVERNNAMENSSLLLRLIVDELIPDHMVE